MWTDIAGVVFVCVTANHLGFIKAVEQVMGGQVPIVNCVKCFSFWTALAYMLITTHDIVLSPTIAFLASYTAIWVELLEGYIDTLYTKCYEKIYPDTKDGAPTANASIGDSTSTMP